MVWIGTTSTLLASDVSCQLAGGRSVTALPLLEQVPWWIGGPHHIRWSRIACGSDTTEQDDKQFASPLALATLVTDCFSLFSPFPPVQC